ncbi:MAG: acylneuraminate cytidylyltransferase family protein [Desulfobacteraceae bacterium]|jgi:CMP-N-acetylneuraminic acid synthetase
MRKPEDLEDETGRSIIAVIPARKGSRRLPGKNTALLNGKPLVAHAIEVALDAGVFSDVFVSTNDPKVVEIAEEKGVALIERPKELCEDAVPVDRALVHVIQFLEEKGECYGAACLMTPTAPLRTVEDVRGAVALLWEKNADFVITVVPYDHTPFHALKIKEGILTPAFMPEDVFTYDQKLLPTLYRPVAVARMGRWEAIKKYGTTFSPGMVPYILPPEHGLDVDNALDLEWAEFLLKRRNRQREL